MSPDTSAGWEILIYLQLMLTGVFHTNKHFRLFCLILTCVLITNDTVKEYLLIGQMWYLSNMLSELVTLVTVYCILSTYRCGAFIILQATILLMINFHQYMGWYEFQPFYDSYLSGDTYLISNWVGFQLILISLWCNTPILDSVKQRMTVNNVLKFILGCEIIILLSNI